MGARKAARRDCVGGHLNDKRRYDLGLLVEGDLHTTLANREGVPDFGDRMKNLLLVRTPSRPWRFFKDDLRNSSSPGARITIQNGCNYRPSFESALFSRLKAVR